MTDYKHTWQEKFDQLCEQGLDEFEAATAADNYIQDYMEQKADHDYEMMKERRLYD